MTNAATITPRKKRKDYTINVTSKNNPSNEAVKDLKDSLIRLLQNMN